MSTIGKKRACCAALCVIFLILVSLFFSIMCIQVVARLPQRLKSKFFEKLKSTFFFNFFFTPLENVSKNVDLSLWGKQCIVVPHFQVLVHCVIPIPIVEYEDQQQRLATPTQNGWPSWNYWTFSRAAGSEQSLMNIDTQHSTLGFTRYYYGRVTLLLSTTEATATCTPRP